MAGRDSSKEKSRFFEANVPVFFGSVALIVAALALVTRDPANAEAILVSVQSWIVHEMGWFYVASVAIFLLFAAGVAMSSVATIKLGPDDSEPDFSTRSWFAMLFSRRHGHRHHVLRRCRAGAAFRGTAGRRGRYGRCGTQGDAAILLPLGTACLGDLRCDGPCARLFFF